MAESNSGCGCGKGSVPNGGKPRPGSGSGGLSARTQSFSMRKPDGTVVTGLDKLGAAAQAARTGGTIIPPRG